MGLINNSLQQCFRNGPFWSNEVNLFHRFAMLFVFYLLQGINAQPQITTELGKARGNKAKEAQCLPPQNIAIKLISVGQLAKVI